MPASRPPNRRWRTTTRGRTILLRPAAPDDAAALAAFLQRLSGRSAHRRYFRAGAFSRRAAEAEAGRIGRVPDRGGLALVALIRLSASDEAVGVAELTPDRGDPTLGHVGILVRDDWQGQGRGTALACELLRRTPAASLATLRADLLAENRAARRLLDRLDLPLSVTTRFGELLALLRLPSPGGPVRRRRAPERVLGDRRPSARGGRAGGDGGGGGSRAATAIPPRRNRAGGTP